MTDDTIKPEEPKPVDGRTKEAREAKKPLRARSDGPSAELAKRRAERKARGSVDHSFDQRLTTAGANLDMNNYSYRWVNDEIGRIQALEGREWERVSDAELNGLEAARHAGMSREGRPMKTVLMKKYKPWFNEDQAEKLRESKEQETALRRGKAKAQVAAQEGAGGSEAFYAKDGNTISTATPTMQPRAAAGYTP